MMSEENALAIGTVIDDRYRLISEGSPQDIGVVHRAYDLQGDRLVDLLVVAARWGGGQEALDRLQWVEQRVAGLSAPRLIPNEQTGLVNEQIYLVRPHMEGQTLADLLARQARLDQDTAVQLTIQLCEALAPAHHAGLTHGSLSTRSVVLRKAEATNEGTAMEVVALDTGLLPALHTPDATNHRPWGRSPYISPEQASGQDVHPTSDVYVIGALLYEMLIGRPPFRAADETVLALQHLHQEPPSIQIMDTSISRPLAQIVYRALAKEPSARYRNAGQLAHILRAQLGFQPEPEPEPGREEPLIVPPPPAPVAGDTWSSTDLYDLEGDKAWGEPSEGVDWVLIALLVAAAIAVLGLIPLWSAVYGRYASATIGSVQFRDQTEARPSPILLGDDHLASLSKTGAELEGQAIVWYNAVLSKISLAQWQAKSTHAQSLTQITEQTRSFGVQLTGQGEKV
jgi:serine/threonine protein kinase